MTGEPLTLGPALLFCPGDRPERLFKAAERSDALILDLEDAVAPKDKDAARDSLKLEGLDPQRTIVRVNATSSEEFEKDMLALASTDFRTIMLAKTESAQEVEAVLKALPEARVIALCESARGVIEAERIAEHPSVCALMWGAEDLVASLGGTSSRFATGAYRDVARHARARVLLAAGAFSKAAIDAVYVDIADLAGLARESEDAVASGFAAKACIHPNQASTVREAFSPSQEEVEEARRLIEAARQAPGVFSFEGRMIDGPLVSHAERVVARAEKAKHGKMDA